MLRENLYRVRDHDPDFEWRGRDVTRIENLSDIVFALSLGMLVSSSQPPLTYPELIAFLMNIAPVSAAFAILVMIWNAHYTYFRRYSLVDSRVIFLNAVLLLFVMFVAFPLRFIFDALFAYGLALAGFVERAQTLGLKASDNASMMAIYAVGYGFIFIILHRMYAHALKNRKLLELSEKEVILTRLTLGHFATQAVLSAMVAALALATPLGAMAGFLWRLNWPVAALLHTLAQRKMRTVGA